MHLSTYVQRCEIGFLEGWLLKVLGPWQFRNQFLGVRNQFAELLTLFLVDATDQTLELGTLAETLF